MYVDTNVCILQTWFESKLRIKKYTVFLKLAFLRSYFRPSGCSIASELKLMQRDSRQITLFRTTAVYVFYGFNGNLKKTILFEQYKFARKNRITMFGPDMNQTSPDRTVYPVINENKSTALVSGQKFRLK